MNSTIIQKLIGICIPVIIFANGCSGTDQKPTTTSPANPLTASTPPTLSPTSITTPTKIPPTLTATTAKVNSISVQDKASFVSENYPDNSVLKPGEAFVKTWKIKNAGILTWTTAYELVVSAAPQGDTLGSPAQIAFPQETAPGQTFDLFVPLVAPSLPGTYTVYWSVQNEVGETVAVDGSNLWVKIQVCEPGQACTAPVAGGGTTAMVSGASVTVTNFTYDAQSATVNYCIAIPGLPDWRFLRAYGAWPSGPKLLIDQKSAPFLSGGSDFPSGDGCAYMVYQAGTTEIELATHVSFVIDVLRMDLPPGDPDVTCQDAHLNLTAEYPGLDFQCHFSMAGFYTGLQVPEEMSREQADRIIMDAIQAAIYGPWILTLK